MEQQKYRYILTHDINTPFHMAKTTIGFLEISDSTYHIRVVILGDQSFTRWLVGTSSQCFNVPIAREGEKQQRGVEYPTTYD